MDNKYCCYGIGFLFAGVLLYGFWNIGDAIRDRLYSHSISTSGVAEKIVKSDIVEVKLVIKNKNEDFAKLYEKRMADKAKVLEFLGICGIDQSEIISITAKTENMGEKEDRTGQTVIVSNQEKYFSSEDIIFLKTSKFESIDKLKDEIMKMSAEGIIVSYKCKYKILNLDNLRKDLTGKAVEKAKENAMLVLTPLNKRIKGVDSVHTSEYDTQVMNETQNSAWSSWERDGNISSLMKKVEQRVNVSFTYE